MNVALVLEFVEQADIHLKAEGFHLKIDAPKNIVTPDLLKEFKVNKTELLLQLDTVIKGIPITELKRFAGDNWIEIENSQTDLEHFANLVSARHMRERGEIPADYTAVTHCQCCGTVPIFAGVPEIVFGCPWCFNRINGRPMPEVNNG